MAQDNQNRDQKQGEGYQDQHSDETRQGRSGSPDESTRQDQGSTPSGDQSSNLEDRDDDLRSGGGQNRRNSIS
jgi:hypothetical protein